MKRIAQIVDNSLWKNAVLDIKKSETNRIFCRHAEEHLMDVARIAYIENLEQGLGFDKETIYAAALVHDIGRSPKYSGGRPHEEAGANMAERILAECGFDETQINDIKNAILAHRSVDTKYDKGLKGLIYRADKKSRLCLFCEARSECNWDDNKMNLEIDI